MGGTRCCVCAAVGENSFARLPFLKIGGNHRPAQLAATRHLHSSHIRKLQHIHQCRGECALASAPTTCACTQSSNNGRVRPDSGFPRIPPSSASCSAFLGHDNVISRASTVSGPSNMKSFFFSCSRSNSPSLITPPYLPRRNRSKRALDRTLPSRKVTLFQCRSRPDNSTGYPQQFILFTNDTAFKVGCTKYPLRCRISQYDIPRVGIGEERNRHRDPIVGCPKSRSGTAGEFSIFSTAAYHSHYIRHILERSRTSNSKPARFPLPPPGGGREHELSN